MSHNLPVNIVSQNAKEGRQWITGKDRVLRNIGAWQRL
jgi:hypothetical protein